jgi:TolB-like protein
MNRKFILFLLTGILGVASCSRTSLESKESSKVQYPSPLSSSQKQASSPEEQLIQSTPVASSIGNLQEITDSLVSQIRSKLPSRESTAMGFVVSVRNQAVYIDLTAKDGIQIGSKLKVYREEEELKHPVTGQTLGIPKQNIGMLQVTQVEQNYSVATVLSLEKGQTVEPKDRVELLAGKMTLALLPFFSHSIRLSSVDFTPLQREIATKLQMTGVVEVIQGVEVEKALKEKGIRPNQILDQKGIKELAEQLKSAYLLDGVIQQEGEKWILMSRLLSAQDGTTLLEASVPLVLMEQVATEEREAVPSASLPSLGSPSTQKAPEGKSEVPGSSKLSSQRKGELVEVGRSQAFPFGIRGLDVGDLYGDGRKEVVIIGRNSVQVYRLPEVFNGNQVELEELYIDRGSGEANYISVGVGDINKNGKDEIFVTDLRKGRLTSFVLEYQQGEFKRIAQDQNLYFRVLKNPKEPPQLLAQHLGSDRPFFGNLMVYEWRDNRYQMVRDLPLSSKVDIYGSAWFNLKDGKDPEVLFLDEEDHLKFFGTGGKLIWRSKEFYGGSRLEFTQTRDQETADTILQVNETREDFQGVWRLTVKEKILTEDLDQDGIPEVILRKNIAPFRPLRGAVSYQKGQMTVLKWNGISFQEQYATPILDSYISDYQLVPGEGPGSDLLIVGLNQDEGFFLPNQQSLIMFFKLKVY